MTQTRRQIKRLATIEEILDIAREEMREKGVAALSLGVVAKRMGMKTPSLYNYFPNKDAIYDELFKRGYQAYSEIAAVRRRRGGKAAERIRDGMVDYMRFAQENPDLYQIMFQRPVPGFVPSEESLAVSLRMLEQSYAEVREILETGELDLGGLPVEDAINLYIALVHGMTEMHLANNPELPVGQGRYGKLIPEAVALLMTAWGSTQPLS